MKNIIIVTKGNNAVGLGDDNKPAVTKTVLNSAFLAGLETLIEMMNGIADTPAETSHFYLPDTLQGIITGASVEYVKTGKTAQGKQLSEQEIKAFSDFYALYAKKILNVRFSLYKYIKKENTELQALKNKAWNALNAIGVNTASQQSVEPVVLDPDKELRAMLDKALKDAIDAGDFDKYDALMARRSQLKEAKVVTTNASSSTTNDNSSNVASKITVKFDDEPIDFKKNDSKASSQLPLEGDTDEGEQDLHQLGFEETEEEEMEW